MTNIWPERSVQLPSEKDGPWLSYDKVEQVLDVVTAGYADRLDKPVALTATVRLLALILLGEDGIGGRRTLYLRVTNECFSHVGPRIRLAIVSYDPVGGGDRQRIFPGKAGDILDGLVRQLQAVPGLTLVASRDS